MSFDFSDNNESSVNIAKIVVTTDPWGSETTVIHENMIFAEVIARDTNKKSGKEEIKINGEIVPR